MHSDPDVHALALEAQCGDRTVKFRIGDLLEAKFPCGEQGRNTGSIEGLKRTARNLKRDGFTEFSSVGYLRALRDTAAAFPDASRDASLSFSVHRVAGDPETLAAVKEKAERENKLVTVAYVSEFKRKRDERAQPDRSDMNGRGPKAAYNAKGDLAKAHEYIQGADKKIRPYRHMLSETDRRDLLKRAQAAASALDSLIDLLQATNKRAAA